MDTTEISDSSEIVHVFPVNNQSQWIAQVLQVVLSV